MDKQRRNAAQAESLSPVPHVHEGMTCMRCGAPDCIIVPNVAPDFKSLQGHGLSQHVMLCSESCQARPWRCAKCEGNNVLEHASHCEVAHPGYRAEWDRRHDVGMMRLTVMVAARGDFLPAFIMDGLFPGFEHADPPSFVAFKAQGART